MEILKLFLCFQLILLLSTYVFLDKSPELSQTCFPYPFIIHALIQQRFIGLLPFTKYCAGHKSSYDIFSMSMVISLVKKIQKRNN